MIPEQRARIDYSAYLNDSQYRESVQGEARLNPVFQLRMGIMYLPYQSIVIVGGERGYLSMNENKMLIALVENTNSVLFYKQIISRVWSNDDNHSDNELARLAHRIREKVEVDPQEPEMILNNRGVGYLFFDPGRKRDVRAFSRQHNTVLGSQVG